MAACTSTRPNFKTLSWTKEKVEQTTAYNKSRYQVDFEGTSINIDTPVNKALARIRQLGMHEDGWYSPDSIGATLQTVKDSENFIWSMDWNNLQQPFIGLAEDGEISFIWKLENKVEIDLGFYGTGTYSYYAKFADGKELLQDDVPANQPLPEEILDCLNLP